MANTNVPQGTTNLTLASVIVPAYPNLNVTAGYLAKAGIALAFTGDSVIQIPTLTGTTTSPQPYIMGRITVNLLRSNGIAATYQSQFLSNAVIGAVTIKPDVTTLPPYVLQNCSIQSFNDQVFNGTTVDMALVITGYLPINSSLWA